MDASASPPHKAGTTHREEKEPAVPVVQEVDRCLWTRRALAISVVAGVCPGKSNAPEFLFWSPGLSQVQLLSSVSLSARLA